MIQIVHSARWGQRKGDVMFSFSSVSFTTIITRQSHECQGSLPKQLLAPLVLGWPTVQSPPGMQQVCYDLRQSQLCHVLPNDAIANIDYNKVCRFRIQHGGEMGE